MVAAVLLAVVSTHSIDAQEDVPDFVRTVVGVLGSGNEQEIRGLLRFTAVPCQLDPEPLSGHPRCRNDEPKGTLIETFPSAACEGFFAREDDLPQDVIDDLTLPGIHVVNVYVLPSGTQSSFFRGEYIAIVLGIQELDTDSGVQSFASAVYLGDGGITGLSRGCASTVESFVDGFGLGEPLDLSLANALPDTGVGPAASTRRSNRSLMLTITGALFLASGLACEFASRRAGGRRSFRIR